MGKATYFDWCQDVQIIYGARCAAIYDFRTEDVYSLNAAATQLAYCIDQRLPVEKIDEKHKSFFEWLQNLDLIKLTDAPVIHYSGSAIPDQHSLDFLWLEVGGSCNLGCSHCYADAQNPNLYNRNALPLPAYTMSLHDWERVIQQASELGCREVQFTGGESLLYRDLLKLIDFAIEKNFNFIEVFSNGMLLTEGKVKELSARNVHLAVSLHGTQAEVHDAVTGLRGSFEYTLRGLKRAKESAIPVRIAGVAVGVNQYDIINLPVFANNLGFSEVRIDVIRNVGSGADPTLMPNNPEVLSKKWLTTPVFAASRIDYDHNRFWNPCWAGKLSISNTGEVLPCIMGRNEVIGNVKDQSLQEIIVSPNLMARWGITKDQIEICKDCEYRYVCGDCRPLAIAKGNLHGSMPRCTYDPYRGRWASLEGLELESSKEYMEPAIELVEKPPVNNDFKFENNKEVDKKEIKRIEKPLEKSPHPNPSTDKKRKSRFKKEINQPIEIKKKRSNSIKFDCDPDR